MADAHLSATLFAMEDEFRRDISVNSDEKESPSVATNLPCASQPCSWNIHRRKRKIEPQPIQSIHLEKPECEREIKHKKIEFNDLRAPHQRTLNSESQKLFYEKVKEVEKITGKGWHSVS